jgi:hypothetical protein
MILDIISGIVGVVCILIGTFAKKFYWTKSLEAIVLQGDRAPTWAGRLLFLIGGLMFILFSIRRLIY